MNILKKSVVLAICLFSGVTAQNAFAQNESLPNAPVANATLQNSGVRGAAWVLARISRPADWGDEKADESAATTAFKNDVAAFGRDSTSLNLRDSTSAQVAQKWLNLALRFQALTRDKEGKSLGNYSYGFSELIEVLPAPQSWNSLHFLIEQRQKTLSEPEIFDRVLLLLGRVLAGSEDEQWNALDSLRAASAAPKPKGGYSGSDLDVGALIEALLPIAGQRRNIERGVAMLALPGGYSTWNAISMPLQIERLDDATTKRLLERAIVTSRVGLNTYALSERNQQLARRIAWQNVAKMTAPQWSFVDSTQALPYYFALEKRFSRVTTEEDDAPYGTFWRDNARQFAIVALLEKNRVAEAQKLISSTLPSPLQPGVCIEFSGEPWMDEGEMPFGSTDEALRSWMSQPAHRATTKKLFDILHAQLKSRPDTPLWQLFETVSSISGHNATLIALYQQILTRADIDQNSKNSWRNRLSRALLANGRTEEGVAQLRAFIKSPPEYNRSSAILPFMKIAAVTERRDWMDEAIALFRTDKSSMGDESERDEVLRSLLQMSRWSDVEAICFDNLAMASKPLPANVARVAPPNETPEAKKARREARSELFEIRSARESTRSSLITLANLYSRLNRQSDVLLLLEKAPFWNARDLSAIVLQSSASEVPLGVFAAKALLARGQNDDAARAVRIMREVLLQKPANDAAYEVLLQAQGKDAMPFLEELAARDRFEERPLIWKAELLRRGGDMVKAERVVRAAIAIDPSDGEQGVGDRFRAYRVLDEVLTARGQTKEALTLRNAVRAIRLSEKADALHEAGLNNQAIDLYNRALTFFSDAYCVQARLAVQLAAAGRLNEASQHYRRAYQLMPSSFGRVESHCFGCEGAFTGTAAQSIAERVFTQMIFAAPRNPQLHYLLGYLRAEQGRNAEALSSFERAVQLDADYLNSWKKIQSVSLELQRPAQVEAATLQIRRLDPQRLHSFDAFYDVPVRGLNALWEQSAQNVPASSVTKTTLMPLPASVGTIINSANSEIKYSIFNGSTPGEALATNAILRALSEFVNADYNKFWNARSYEMQMRERDERHKKLDAKPTATETANATAPTKTTTDITSSTR